MPRSTATAKPASPSRGAARSRAVGESKRGKTQAQSNVAHEAVERDLAQPDVPWLVIREATHNNLQQVTAGFPLGRFTCVTGVSGSGKSSLVNDILFEALQRDLNGATTAEPGAHGAIDGLEHLDKIIAIDQTPIGRTPRSNPATYIKVFDEIRNLFAKLPDAKVRGYKPGRFSFNVPDRKGGGRCEACEGNGSNRIEMDFLADVWVECPVCSGRRFGRETQQIQYKGKSIADVLEMDVQQALEHFENVPRIQRMLQTLHDVGLDYLKLGQSSTTISGGEAQRVKLAKELVKKSTGRTIYVLDEPTTGLHFEDIRRLLTVLHGFVDAGNTVVVIEHNLDVIKTADWVIDLGPEGGRGGGRILGEGTPEEIARLEGSHTGKALAEELGLRPRGVSGNAGKPRRGGRKRQATSVVLPSNPIRVRGAEQHNLKDVSVDIPRHEITVCTGVSGSGKTSFAIDTVFTEGYRRYVESLSSYARQFLGQLRKPKVEHVEGLAPAICIEQKAASKSPRSTVGTITEVYDYMRVLWARLGQPYCPTCQEPMGSQTVDEICDRVMGLPEGSPIIILAPLTLGDAPNWGGVFKRLKSSGYARVRIDGVVTPVADAELLDARRKHRVELVIDRAVVRGKNRSRISESLEHAISMGKGVLMLHVESVERVPEGAEHDPDAIERTPEQDLLFSAKLACLKCGTSYEELGPHHFSFNSQLGWCETCEGLGVQRGAPASVIIAEPRKTLFDGALAGWERVDRRSKLGKMLAALCEHLGVDSKAPLTDWNEAQRRKLLFGTHDAWLDAGKTFPGVRFQWRGLYPALDHATRNSWSVRHRLRSVISEIPCMTCQGGRLRSDAASVRLADMTIVDLAELPLDAARDFFAELELDAREQRIAGELLKEISDRLTFLVDVGLDYVNLHRSAPTLSGGEAQRIRLASQVGSGLSGVLYVLDEPTIGLHPRDTQRLTSALHKLRDLGNTLLLVEHDREVIESSDRLLDFGPRAGRYGGELVQEGPIKQFLKPRRKSRKTADADAAGDGSLTRAYLSGSRSVPIPSNRRPIGPVDPSKIRTQAQLADTEAKRKKTRAERLEVAEVPGPDDPPAGWLLIDGVRHNNLRDISVPIPLGRLTVVTGVSGSGKSSLVNDVLHPRLAAELHNAADLPGEHEALLGIGQIDKVINVDQAPIGATPSSNPATYTGTFEIVRQLFAKLPDSKVRGYGPNRFSFNRPGGRCEACEGYGQQKIEMHFMPDVWIECDTCHGKRYTAETLDIRFKGQSIADVLEMQVDRALELFENVPKLRRVLQTLADVGLDYIQLGQPAPTLSGGEAQRVKLAAELGKPNTGKTLYILDEPTTGLHFDDVRKLLDVLQRLTDFGNTVIVVEHNLDVIKSADWLVDLGPEAGAGGGALVGLGVPEEFDSGAAQQLARRFARAGRSGAAKTVHESHTARILEPVLAEGPYEVVGRHDPRAYAQRDLEADKAGLGDVGKQVKLPWQVDGRKWHLEQRTSRNATPTRWQPQALEYALDLVQSLGDFSETNWNNQSSIEITHPDADVWFLHALTGGEWLFELYFRVPKGTFDWEVLADQLGLKTLDERDDLEAYGDWSRVDVRPRRDGPDAVVVYVHDKREIDTTAFKRFVRQAIDAYTAAYVP